MSFTLKVITNVTFAIIRQHSFSRSLHESSLKIIPITATCKHCNQIRKISSTPPKSKEERNEKHLDRVRIYAGPLATQIRMVKYFSLMSSGLGLAIQPLLYKAVANVDSISVIVGAYSFAGFFTLGTPILLHLVAKKYVIQLDYKPETNSYIATTLNIFCIPKQLEFKPEDVEVPDVPGMFTTFIAKKTPLFVDLRFFKDPSHYGKIMGYDKPIDLKLFQTSSNCEDSKQ